MADQLASPSDLAVLLGIPLDAPKMTLVIEAATAVVQAITGQRLVEVEDDEITLLGSTDSWLDLPQRPVTAISVVNAAGVVLAEGTGRGMYRQFGARLWRSCGWAECAYEPSAVTVTYSHGYPAGDQGLQVARQATLGLAAGVYNNPGGGVSREQIDDYTVAYEAAAAAMDGSPHLRSSLRRQYSRRSGLVRIG